ncbi:P-loop NTPase fold protein [Streptomyces sp. NPDC091281]|uniref:P-loop NTPase fold protein n=1 Tax=Streptomyces sp. NPDC091281 TaxID=3365985 RepID=UPI0038196243
MSNGGYHWRYGERAVYEQAVRACLGDRRLRELLRRRPYVTEESVVDAMCAPPVVNRVLSQSDSRLGHRLHLRVGRLHERSRIRPGPIVPEAFGGWLTVSVVLLGLLSDTNLPLPVTVATALTPALGVGAYTYARSTLLPAAPVTPRAMWRSCVVALPLMPVVIALWVMKQLSTTLWTRELRRAGLADEVSRAVEELLGDERGTLLITSSHEGLRAPRQRSYFVANGSAAELDRKMGQLDGGVIAVSGPRGVGKTSLMENCVREDDFAVFAHAPATYAPHDFLTSLFVSVCRTYITRAGFDAPEFVRLSYLRRVTRAMSRPLRYLGRRLLFAVPAVTLVAVGLYATERSLERDRLPDVERHVADYTGRGTGFVADVLGGREPEAALALAAAGIVLWFLRDNRTLAKWARLVSSVLFGVTVATLLCGPFLSLLWDEQLRQHAPALANLWFVPLFALWFACGLGMSDVNEKGPTTRLLWWPAKRAYVYGLPARLLPLVILVLVGVDERTRPLLTDPDHAVRVGVFVLGLVLLKLGSRPWSFLRPAPRLVTDCRDHLYRLQTVQSASAALNSGAAQVLTLGTAHTTTLTSVPPNYPALVDDFRALLTRIASYEHGRKHRVVIVIDELDRLGSDTKALAFLAEVKAILGVPHVHYLVSVAEDVGAAFVRRGLPYRDVTDSSLDDVLHVRPGTAADAVRMLGVRAPGIGEPYVLLAHALSGGLPRDLVRYARRLLEIKAATEQVELPDVAGLLILEELAETLAGFRTLLAKQPWTAGDPDVLGLFRDAAAHLRTACPCTLPMRALRPALLRLAVPGTTGLAEEPRRLVDEAAAYVSLALTLLDVFGPPDFNRRRADAEAASPDGGPDALAEARQELALSPYTARTVIDAVRRAWGLAPLTAPAAAVPPQRRPPCARHPRRTAPVG